jgi:hypothetical protein
MCCRQISQINAGILEEPPAVVLYCEDGGKRFLVYQTKQSHIEEGSSRYD